MKLKKNDKEQWMKCLNLLNEILEDCMTLLSMILLWTIANGAGADAEILLIRDMAILFRKAYT